MRRISAKLFLLGLVLVNLLGIAQPLKVVAAGADPLDATCAQADAAATSLCKSKADDTKNPVNSTIGKAISVLLIAAGVASVIMIIVGGFQYVLSTGDSAKVNSAKNTILYAVVGLVISLFAELIVKYVVRKL